jgi:hypothetical protein
MPVPKGLITVIREWLAKADNDLQNAVHTLTLGKDCPTDTVCFHAQQCIEKHIKALLVFRATVFPKTHTIHTLRVVAAEAPSETGPQSPGSPDTLCHGPALSWRGTRRSLEGSAQSGSDCQTCSQRSTETPAESSTSPEMKVRRIRRAGKNGLPFA